MKLETKRIETKRLILRQFEIEDAHDMFVNYASDPEVTKYLSWPAYTEEAEAVGRMHWMRDQYAAGNVGDWAIELKEIGQLIGEAFAAVISYCFTEGGVNRIEAMHDPNNPHSGDVMKKCGLRYEGTSRQSDWNNQGICDAAHYAILKEDWLKGKSL